MTVKIQKKINFNNLCGCIVDYELLEKAILWFSKKPVNSIKPIYLFGRYPAVSIHKSKVHVHRLIISYLHGFWLENKKHVHHIDKNRMNSLINNLEVISASEHASGHFKGVKFTQTHREKLSEANRERKGTIKFKKRILLPLEEIHRYRLNGWSINRLASHYKVDWSTIKQRLNENPELMEGEKWKNINIKWSDQSTMNGLEKPC